MRGRHHHRRPLRFRRSRIHIIPCHGPRQIVQTRPGHAHERHPLPPQIRSSQIPRRLPRYRRNHRLYVLREREEERPQELWEIERIRRHRVGAAHRDVVPLGEPVTRRSREQHPRSDLPDLQTVWPANDVTHQSLLNFDLDPTKRFTPPAHSRHSPHRCRSTRTRVRNSVFEYPPGRSETSRPVRHHRRFRSIIHLRDPRTFRFLDSRVRS